MECDVYALRGATTVENDEKEEIGAAVKEMYETLLEKNRLSEDELVFAHFSMTKDIKSMNAASALRASGYGAGLPLFCTQEADVDGGKEKCIRVLLLVKGGKRSERIMVYLRGAKSLRPDISGEEK